MYIVPSSGGAPRQLEAAFTSAGAPVWFPDGRHLLFLGRRDASVPTEKTYDWWVASLDGSPPVKTGAYERAHKYALRIPSTNVPKALPWRQRTQISRRLLIKRPGAMRLRVLDDAAPQRSVVLLDGGNQQNHPGWLFHHPTF
jgi:hypothetical protein